GDSDGDRLRRLDGRVRRRRAAGRRGLLQGALECLPRGLRAAHHPRHLRPPLRGDALTARPRRLPPLSGTVLERRGVCRGGGCLENGRPRKDKTMGLILLILLVLLALGAIPAWPYSRNWGYGPSGGLGLVLLIVLVLVLVGKL